MRLDFAATTDVGRYRKDNQDSGYAGPHLLAVCDGVGGAARGDIASSTVLGQLKKLDAVPSDDLIGQVAGALHRAHDRIGELVDEDPALNGTSTTATVALFDGTKLGMGHVGDSRAYLLRDRQITQLTKDHTFVQTLIDEGRITEEESRTHPHRNLILRAVDGTHDLEPDVFEVPLQPGDRLLLCSDGASGVLDEARLTDILTTGSPDFAATELVRASLEAGSTDNVTCVVADVVGDDARVDDDPVEVGAIVDLRRGRRVVGGLFRGHRSGDTGEMEPIVADLPDDVPYAITKDPIDPEAARYAPRERPHGTALRRLLLAVVVLGIVWIGTAVAWSWSQNQFYVGEYDGKVTIFRGVDASIGGLDLSKPFETTDLAVDDLAPYDRGTVQEGIGVDDLQGAHAAVDNLRLADEGGG